MEALPPTRHILLSQTIKVRELKSKVTFVLGERQQEVLFELSKIHRTKRVRDLRKAYRRLSVDPADYRYFGYMWNGLTLLILMLPSEGT